MEPFEKARRIIYYNSTGAILMYEFYALPEKVVHDLGLEIKYKQVLPCLKQIYIPQI